MRETLENLALPRTSPFLTLLVSMYNRVLSNDAQFWDGEKGCNRIRVSPLFIAHVSSLPPGDGAAQISARAGGQRH